MDRIRDVPSGYMDRATFYHIRVEKKWFRGKDVFPFRMFQYEKQLLDEESVDLYLNAGNMIYVMLRRLALGIDWEKQDALIHSYRDLVYKLSYTGVSLHQDDLGYLHLTGQKSDVMWTISFLSQVFPEQPVVCQTVVSKDAVYDGVKPLTFAVQDGNYVGENAIHVASVNDALPDIWSVRVSNTQADYVSESENLPKYDSNHSPENGEMFVLPDGRVASYIRMDERFVYAEKYGRAIDPLLRHNITASLMKEFEDLVHTQMQLEYEVYHMRYVAFMNKVHELDKLLGGLEISAYDVLPIGERGLPYASSDTIERTNQMERGSLSYLIDMVKRNVGHLTADEKKKLILEAGRSVIFRLKGYDMEYQMYVSGGSSEELCKAIYNDYCYELYADFAELDSYKMLVFPGQAYKYLCNDPEKSVYYMTEWERQKLRMFGRGYADFVAYQLKECKNKKLIRIYETALELLESRYLKRG